jgi:predicted enzyme related to lactoylglutathione lyase
MPRITHFEIHTDDPERAAEFYRAVFGWKIEKWKGPMDYWMVDTGKGAGINGGLLKRMHPKPKSDTIMAYVCTVDVDNIDDFIKRVTKNGGTIVSPKSELPGVGLMAQCKDTEGNLFGLWQPIRK